MRKLRAGVLLESKYPGVILGAVTSDDGTLLVDVPLRTDDGRDWMAQLNRSGRPRYLALMDQHPDRALGARIHDLPIVSHETTLLEMHRWPDAYKGAARPVGGEADSLKRITGVAKAVPDVGFSEELKLHLGEREILFWHRPGPTSGAMWVVLPEARMAFIGDAVTVSEPPYVGNAAVDDWLETLDELRSSDYDDWLFISGRDGPVNRDQINDMARFVRKIPIRLKRMASREDSLGAADTIAKELIKEYKIPSTRRDQILLRLTSGLRTLYTREYPNKG